MDVVQWTIDSIENEVAVIEESTGKVFQVPVRLLPPGIRAGQVCQVSTRAGQNQSAVTTITLDDDATRRALARSAEQLASTPKSKDPGGPIKL